MSDPRCTCPHGMGAGGTLYGVQMPREIARLSTTKDCPVHDACQGYTAEYRKADERWGAFWCPIHRTANCPVPLSPESRSR